MFATTGDAGGERLLGPSALQHDHEASALLRSLRERNHTRVHMGVPTAQAQTLEERISHPPVAESIAMERSFLFAIRRLEEARTGEEQRLEPKAQTQATMVTAAGQRQETLMRPPSRSVGPLSPSQRHKVFRDLARLPIVGTGSQCGSSDASDNASGSASCMCSAANVEGSACCRRCRCSEECLLKAHEATRRLRLYRALQGRSMEPSVAVIREDDGYVTEVCSAPQTSPRTSRGRGGRLCRLLRRVLGSSPSRS